MLADQAARAERQTPINRKQQVQFAKTLLAKLDGVEAPRGPARITTNAPPPLANDHIPDTLDPEPIGGCFSDLLDDK